MYRARSEFTKIAKKYKTKYYKEILGINYGFTSSIINGNKNCSEIIAKGLLSICFEIPLTHEEIPLLLNKYFIKTKE